MGYLELIYRCLLEDMYAEMTCKKISFEEIIYVYKNIHLIIV
jgi:hypothetical protein